MISVTGKRRGVTLIELLFVVIIVGILIRASLLNFRTRYENILLDEFSRDFGSSISYLAQRSIVEGVPIELNIDDQNREYWAQAKGGEGRLVSGRIPQGITVQAADRQILFYPDGSIDKVTIRLLNSKEKALTLTTKGIFGGSRIQKEN